MNARGRMLTSTRGRTLTSERVNGLSFAEWCDRLDAYHTEQRQAGVFEGYGAGSVVEMTGAECWLDFFFDGFSPEDALDEDRDCWE